MSLGIEIPDRSPAGLDRALPRRRLPPDQAQDRAGLGCRRRAPGPRPLSRTFRSRSTPTRPTRSTTCRRSRQLDDFDLLLIEQPLADDDIIDHARLQESLKTPDLPGREHPLRRRRPQGPRPGCLPRHQYQGQPPGWPARGQACSRSLLCARSARLVRRHARVRHRPGGQRRDRVACRGSRIPGDVSGSDKYYAEDIVAPPILAHEGRSTSPTAAGLGVEPIEDRIRARTIRQFLLSA